MPTCDLHMHTHYSDARPTPEELVRHAAHIGLKTIAITDHGQRGKAHDAATLDHLGDTTHRHQFLLEIFTTFSSSFKTHHNYRPNKIFLPTPPLPPGEG